MLPDGMTTAKEGAPIVATKWGMGQALGRSRDTEYVFDLASDPEEMVNLAGLASVEVDWLRSRLLAWVERGMLRQGSAEAPDLDEETRKRLEALGYLN